MRQDERHQHQEEHQQLMRENLTPAQKAINNTKEISRSQSSKTGMP